MSEQHQPSELSRGREINLADLTVEGVINAIRLSRIERIIHSNNTFLVPPSKLDLEESELLEEMSNYADDEWSIEENKRKNSILLKEKGRNANRIHSAKDWLIANEHTQETPDDEQVATIYTDLILKQYIKAFNSVLISSADSIKNLGTLRDLISVLETPNGSSPATRHAKYTLDLLLKDNKKVDIAKPELGKITDFIKVNVKPIPIDELNRNTTIYLDSMNVMGEVFFSEGSTVPNIRIFMEQGFHSKGTSGLPMKRPSLELQGVTGNVYPIDFHKDLEPNVTARNNFFDQVFNHLAERGLNQIATHTFDPKYLIGSIASGVFLIPHLDGFPVESARIEEGVRPKLQYVTPDFPYFFYILNGTSLLDQFPRNKPENNFNGFHFINEGLPFASKSFLHCVVPKVLRVQLLKWIHTMSSKEVAKIFGDKEPEKFFVSD